MQQKEADVVFTIATLAKNMKSIEHQHNKEDMTATGIRYGIYTYVSILYVKNVYQEDLLKRQGKYIIETIIQ